MLLSQITEGTYLISPVPGIKIKTFSPRVYAAIYH